MNKKNLKFLFCMFIFVAAIFAIFSCVHKDQQESPGTKQEGPKPIVDEPLEETKISPELKKLMKEPLDLDEKGHAFRAITLNSPFSNGSTGKSGYPKSTVIRDYRPGSDYLGLLHVKLDNEFERHLPDAIKEQLKSHNVYQNNKTDLFFIVQSSEDEISKHIAPNNNGSDFTGLLPHGQIQICQIIIPEPGWIEISS